MMDRTKQSVRVRSGFTLVEVIVALMIAAIVLSAAATMASALTSGNTACSESAANAAWLLGLQTRLSDLIMQADSATSLATGVSLTLGAQTVVLQTAADGQGVYLDGQEIGGTYENDLGITQYRCTGVSISPVYKYYSTDPTPICKRVAVSMTVHDITGNSMPYQMTYSLRAAGFDYDSFLSAWTPTDYETLTTALLSGLDPEVADVVVAKYVRYIKQTLTTKIERATKVMTLSSPIGTNITLWTDADKNGIAIAAELTYIKTQATYDWAIVKGLGFEDDYKLCTGVKLKALDVNGVETTTAASVKSITVEYKINNTTHTLHAVVAKSI